MRRNKHNDLEEHLREIRVLSHCDKYELSAIARMAEERMAKAGDTLTLEGDQAREIFLIRKGEATVYREQEAIARLVPGMLFGEMAVLAGGRRRATIIADTDMELEVISRLRLIRLLEEAPVLTLKILQAVSARLQESDFTGERYLTKSAPAEGRGRTDGVDSVDLTADETVDAST